MSITPGGLSSAVEGYPFRVPQDRRLLAVLPLITVLLLAGCVGPTLTASGYRHKVTDTVRTVGSAVASGTYAAQLDLDGRLALAVADTVVSNAEDDADSAQSALDSREPPDDRSLAFGDKARQSIQDAVDGLRELRIAVRRGDRAAIRKAIDDLAGPARQLAELSGS